MAGILDIPIFDDYTNHTFLDELIARKAGSTSIRHQDEENEGAGHQHGGNRDEDGGHDGEDTRYIESGEA